MLLAPASAPQDLAVDKVTADGTKLSWKKPKSDGGTPITGYVVEKKNPDGEWEVAKTTKDPEAFIPMKEGEKAQFRVLAVNDDGEGEPSRPTSTITAEHQPMVPHVAGPNDNVVGGPGSGVGGLQDITVKVHSVYTFELPNKVVMILLVLEKL